MLTAITGGIAEGKSTVLSYLTELGYKTLSADLVAREIFSDREVNRLLAIEAGEAAPISPQALRQALVEKPEIRRSINRIMHQRILDRIRRADVEFAEIPLLIETCTQGQFDRLWVVTCGPDEQQRRLRARYGLSFDIDGLLRFQLATTAKIPFADEVLRTDCDSESVRQGVSEALARRFE